MRAVFGVSVAKGCIVTMINYDRDKEREVMMSESLPAAAAATSDEPRAFVKKVARGSLASRIASLAAKGAAASAPLPSPPPPPLTYKRPGFFFLRGWVQA